jgi:hypothetical protein
LIPTSAVLPVVTCHVFDTARNSVSCKSSNNFFYSRIEVCKYGKPPRTADVGLHISRKATEALPKLLTQQCLHCPGKKSIRGITPSPFNLSATERYITIHHSWFPFWLKYTLSCQEATFLIGAPVERLYFLQQTSRRRARDMQHGGSTTTTRRQWPWVDRQYCTSSRALAGV